MTNRRVALLILGVVVLSWVSLTGCSRNGQSSLLYVGKNAEVLVDSTTSMSAQEVMRSRDFRPSDAQHPNIGFTTGAVWVRFSLQVNESGVYVLDVGREWLDSVALYGITKGKPHLLGRSGTALRIEKRPIQTLRVVFPIPLQKGQRKDFLVRIESRSPIAFYGVLRKANAYAQANVLEQLLFGGFIALMLGLAAYSFLLFLMLREYLQLYVALLLLFYASAECASHGYVSWLLQVQGGWMELRVGSLFFGAFILLLLLMAREVGKVARKQALVASVINVSPTLIACVHPRWYHLTLLALGMSVAYVLGVLGLAVHRHKHKAAKTFVVAVSCLLIPGSITICIQFGILPTFSTVEFAHHLGASAMSVLFALLVADNIRQDRGSIQNLNEALGEQVEELHQTQGELEHANEALRKDRQAIDLLNRELESRLAQLEEAAEQLNRANEELRFQVAARSSTLVNLLAKHKGPVKAAPPAPGEIFDERYQIQEVLGSGGWGLVYRVERLSDKGLFALKLLTRDLSGRKAARLAREAEIGASLHHPNLVGFVDVGIHAGGAPYVVMELSCGGSLDEHKDRFGDLPWILPLLRDAALGIAALHENNIIHRDIKPGNLLLDVSGDTTIARIADFGISVRELALSEETATTPDALDQMSRLTQAGALLGTPAYMAPELLHSGRESTPASDIFAFGILIFEALMGSHPFELLPIKALLAGVPFSPPALLETPDEALNAHLQELILRSLYIKPQARPPIQELVQALEEVCLLT